MMWKSSYQSCCHSDSKVKRQWCERAVISPAVTQTVNGVEYARITLIETRAQFFSCKKLFKTMLNPGFEADRCQDYPSSRVQGSLETLISASPGASPSPCTSRESLWIMCVTVDRENCSQIQWRTRTMLTLVLYYHSAVLFLMLPTCLLFALLMNFFARICHICCQ